MKKRQFKKQDIEPKNLQVEAAKKGDQNAMHKLYSIYSVAMLNAAFRILNNRQDAEDVLQESFIKAFSNISQYNYQSTFGAWLKRIVINNSIDQLKKKNGLIFQEQEHIESLVAENLVIVDYQQKMDLLYRALHQLPIGYRTVFSLYMLEGYDHSEIAEILGVEVSTSISQLSRAKKKLKSVIIKEEQYG